MGKQSLSSALKGTYPWLIMLGLALLIKLYDFLSTVDYTDLATLLVIIIGGVLILLLAVFLIKKTYLLVNFIIARIKQTPILNATKLELHGESFRYQPWLYNRHILILSGQIDKVFAASWRKDVKYSLRFLLHHLGLRKNAPQEKQIIRILISSPQIKQNNKLLVIHDIRNLAYIPQQGDLIEVKGEYIHEQPLLQGLYGSGFTYYGHLRFCEQPSGYIKKLDDVIDLAMMPEAVDCGLASKTGSIQDKSAFIATNHFQPNKGKLRELPTTSSDPKSQAREIDRQEDIE
ncbi:MAG: hypothetical protein IT292_00405 [Deltaproteobacteria bacterium]|nr:hypothetical protein [Deltaproteobacteria bacterium]